MQLLRKLAVVVGAAAGFSVLGGVAWFAWLLLTSPPRLITGYMPPLARGRWIASLDSSAIVDS